MKRVLILFCLVVLVMQFVSSTIIIYDEPHEEYNLGSSIFVNFSIENEFSISDFVQTFLKCGSDEFVVTKNYVETESKTKKYFSNEFPAPISGDCRFYIDFNDEEVFTNEFKISNKIIVDAKLNGLSFSPGENIIISGSARKEDNSSFNGIVTAGITEIFEKSVEIENGSFSFNFDFANDLPAGDYKLHIDVIEKDWKGNIINSGEEFFNITINSIPREILINSLENVLPPINYSIDVKLVDQTGKAISNETILLKILDTSNNIVFEKSIISGETVEYFFMDNSSKGGWNINAYYGNLFSTKTIYIDANKEVEVTVEDEKVNIENIGNSLYEGVVSFIIKNNSFEEEIFLNVSIPVGEIYEYPLNFSGFYNISSGEENFNNVYLTGASIFTTPKLNLRSYILGFSIILIFILIFLFRKKLILIFKKNKTKKVFTNKVVKNKVNVCMVFLKFDKFFHIDDIYDAYGFYFKKVSDNLGYVLFYSPSEKNPEKKMFNFAKTVMNAAKDKNSKVSMVVNCVPFDGVQKVKDFASLNRKILSFSSGEIFIPKRVYQKISSHPPKKTKIINVSGQDIEVCVL